MTRTAEGGDSLADAAYRRLRADIVSCRLAPGQRLTERGLAFETGWGISPIREALTRLDHDGFVTTLPRRGYVVTPLSEKSVNDLFELWRVIGPELARLGVERATPEQMDRIRELATTLNDPERRTNAVTEEALRRTELTLTTFDVLAESTGNDYLISVYHRIAGDLSRVAALLLNSALAEQDGIAVGAPRIDRMLAGDAAGAADDVLHFVDHARERVLQILSRGPHAATSETLRIRVAPRHTGSET